MNVQTKIEADLLYERDVYEWTRVQTDALESRDAAALDWMNLAEEIRSLGTSQLSEMQSRMTVILEHLLKSQFALTTDPARGWKRTILTQRGDLENLFIHSPSLRRRAVGAVAKSYRSARKRALVAFEEYEAEASAHYRSVLPLECPYTIEQILDEDWLPDSVA